VTRPDNFILRWARMKRGLDTAHEPAVAGKSLPSASAEAGADAATAEPFDLASLPSIESIVADTDIIGIAENQWDFNDPDAIPGFGPLRATDNVPTVLRQVASKLGNVPETFLETPPSVVSAPPGVADCKPSAGEQSAQFTPADPGISVLSDETRNAELETDRARAVEECDASRKSRRHGSALPR